MRASREQLADLVRSHREQRRLTQQQLAEQAGPPANRSTIAHIEQAVRLPKPAVLETVCSFLGIPRTYWEEYANESSLQRLRFEEQLSELVGRPVSLVQLTEQSRDACERLISQLLDGRLSERQTHDLFNSILIYYGQHPVSASFFDKYLGPRACSSLELLEQHIQAYQNDAIRLFSTFGEAFVTLSSASDITQYLSPLKVRNLSLYTNRSDWHHIEQIPDDRLPDLGYISAERVRQETKERQALKTFLERLAANVRKDGRAALDQENEKTKRRMDSLLRRFNSSIENGLFSPLFQPDPDAIEREAARLAPKTDTEIARISETQAIAERNLSHYLSADYLDVYVATSMRSDADFISVNRFAKALFGHSRVKALNLRYFNPTQSWIDDRIAKGLVEALMLRRADVTIYMAQKADSFGKDSEASVALGQGKPVVVYVPKLHVPSAKIDSEELARKSRSDRIEILRAVDSALLEDLDDSVDDEALLSRILQARLATLEDGELIEVLREHAADFDLLAEAERVPESNREEYRRWIEDVVEARTAAVPSTLRRHIDGILVAVAARFERRAHLFREIHPLALQVILSTGVLNGILVVRSVEQCAVVLEALITNSLRMRLEKDDQNYRLIEENTGSTVRVISRHTLLRNAFESFYFSQVRRDERKTG